MKKVYFNYRWYEFRECDTANTTQEELQKMATELGSLQYEPGGKKWLVIPGIGYGWEV